MAQPSIYLDYAAATPLDPAVDRAMRPYLSQNFYNPSALYLPAKRVARDIAAARQNIASIIGARPSEIVFTAGGTEANNLAIQGVMRRFPDGEAVVSAVEHESVLAPAEGYARRLAPVTADGSVDVAALENSITDKTVLVSVMYANNEVGTIQPLHEIAKMLQNKRAKRLSNDSSLPLYFHTDACQAAAYLDLHVSRLGVDLMTVNGGKIYGPKQSGILYVKAGLSLDALVKGGGQENGRRSGTENVAGSIGFAAALELVQSRRKAEAERLAGLQREFIAALNKAVPAAVINGSHRRRLPNNVHVTIPGTDNERVLMELDEAGIMAAAGSACSASNDEPSHVLRAMGISEADAYGSLRFTFGLHTTAAQLKYTVETLKEILKSKA